MHGHSHTSKYAELISKKKNKTISDSHLLIQFLFRSKKNIMQNINVKELHLGIQLCILNKTL